MSGKAPVVHTHGPRACTGLLRELLRESNGLYNLLLKRPLEFRDRLTGYVDTAAEMLLGSKPVYETISLSEALHELEDAYGGPARTCEEYALASIEEHIRRTLEEIRDNDPFDQLWAADSPQARCCYLACRLVQPDVVIETGIAYGATSAAILEALKENGHGKLYSIDLPSLRSGADNSWGVIVDETLKERWHTYRGSSRRILPGLLQKLGSVDLFLHDSLHTRRHMQWEFDAVWPYLRERGMVMADDVDRNQAFGALRQRKPTMWNVVEAEHQYPASGTTMPTTFGLAIK